MATTATWPSASDATSSGASHASQPWVVLGVAGSKRTRELRASCARHGRATPRIIEWADWLRHPQVLDAALAGAGVFKIEPPGDDPLVHHALMQRGALALGMPAPAALQPGELAGCRPWFEGFCLAMQALTTQLHTLLPQHASTEVVNAPSDIIAMTDKFACQQRLQAHGIATPPLLGTVGSHEELLHLVQLHGLDRVFLKARYGSSAAGVVAYRRNRRGQQQATTTARLVRGTHGTRLFNHKRVSRYERPEDIREVIDRIAADGAYAEGWIAKPRCGDGHFDLRVLALRGVAAQRVARVSRQTMTNLHLDAQREDPQRLLSADALLEIEQTVARAATAFAHSQVIGFDIVPHRHGPQVLEANAFGDLLPGLLWRGLDAHAAWWVAP